MKNWSKSRREWCLAKTATQGDLSRLTLGQVTHLYLHTLWLDDVDFVLVAAPHLVVHHGHAADGVVGPPQVHQVVVGQIPLPVWQEDISHKITQMSRLDVPANMFKHMQSQTPLENSMQTEQETDTKEMFWYMSRPAEELNPHRGVGPLYCLPSARWKMAKVPSASATKTRPLTCLQHTKLHPSQQMSYTDQRSFTHNHTHTHTDLH